MEENRKYTEPHFAEEEYDEIDIMELLRKLFKEWKLILKWCGIAAVAGLVIGFSIPREYSVTSKLAPESVTKSGGGALGSLASLAGINLGAMSSSDAVSPDLYPDIVSSTPFVVELFPIRVDFEHRKDDVSTDYYTYLKEYTRQPWWSVVMAAPFRALGWFTGLLRGREEPVEGYADLDPSALTPEQEEIADAIRKNISLMVDKKTSILALTVTAQDPHVAARVSEEVIGRVQTYVTNYRTEKSRQDRDYYQKLYDESQANYFAAQQRYASYVDRNQGVILQSVRTEQTRLQNEMELSFQLYNACAQQLQAAKAQVQQETPVFTIIDPPQVPLRRSKPNKVIILAACIFLAGAGTSFWILWGRDMVEALRKKDDEE